MSCYAYVVEEEKKKKKQTKVQRPLINRNQTKVIKSIKSSQSWYYFHRLILSPLQRL